MKVVHRLLFLLFVFSNPSGNKQGEQHVWHQCTSAFAESASLRAETGAIVPGRGGNETEIDGQAREKEESRRQYQEAWSRFSKKVIFHTAVFPFE
jgi:hypothetical protein